MKKTYLKPFIKTATIGTITIMCGSVISDKGIEYGGMDCGEHTPASRQERLWGVEEDGDEK